MDTKTWFYLRRSTKYEDIYMAIFFKFKIMVFLIYYIFKLSKDDLDPAEYFTKILLVTTNYN